MISVLIAGFIIGILATSGLMHFLAGAKGMKMPLFGKMMPSVVAVLLGWVFITASVPIWWYAAEMGVHPRAALVAISAGALLAGITYSQGWIRDIIHKSK